MRISCAWSPGGTKTFRNRSGKIFDLWGRNLQNPSDEEKRYFIPDDGYEFIQIDVAGAEAVIVGYLCRPGRYRDLTIYGVKHHSYIATDLFKEYWSKTTPYDIKHLLSLEIKDLSENPNWRALAKIVKDTDSLEGKERKYYIGKKTGLSFNYGEGPNTFRFVVLKETGGKLVLSAAEAALFKHSYENLFPEIVDWQKRTEEKIRETRQLRNLYGHPFNITGIITDKTIREGIAWEPQSTVGVLGTNAFVKMQKLSGHRCDILNNMHDSVLIQAPRGQCALECAHILKEQMEPTFTSPYDGVKFKMKTEVSIGMNWAKFDEKRNPEGLKEIKLT